MGRPSYGQWIPRVNGTGKWEWNARGLNMTMAVEHNLYCVERINNEWQEWLGKKVDPPYREMDVYFGGETAPDWGWPGLLEDRV